MKLLSFFKLTYLLPSTIFLVISIIIAFLCTLTYLKDYNSDEHIDIISSKNDKNNWILISSIKELLSHRIQTVFDYLINAESYLKKFHSLYDKVNMQQKQDFVNEHLINLKKYYIDNTDNERDHLDKMTYIIDDTDDQIIFTQEMFDTLTPKKKLQYQYLFLYSQLIPIFKSFYTNFSNKEGFSLDSLYIMNRKTETFVLYPAKHNSNYEKIFSFYRLSPNYIKNPNNCRNKKRQIPDYFYIFCREAFKNINTIYKINQKRTLFITSPYKNLFDNKTDADNVISICHIFNLTQEENSEYVFDDYYQLFLNDEIVICADIVINNYFKILSNFEEQLSGYFYITKTNSITPLFFPGMNDDLYPNDITRFEFNFSFYKFDTTNVVDFNTYVLPMLIKEYDENNDLVLPNEINSENNNKDKLLYYSVKNDKNTFIKGNLDLKYFIYPIYFNNFDIKEHILSIIYVVDKNIYKNQLDFLSPKLYEITFVTLFIGIIFVIMMAYVIHYIIYIFSMNMTKSIKLKLKQNAKLNQKKNVKYYYQGIDINKLITLGLIQKKAKKHKLKSELEDEYSNNDFDRNSNDIFGRFIYGNENILKKNNENDEELDKLLEKKDENSKEEEEENESEDAGILPVLIDSQFNDKVKLLYDLNKVRSFMRGEQINLKGNNITKFISCQNIFNEMKDKLGENMCLSNVGNLENLNNKYDKAIIFFSKSLNIENNPEEKNSEEIYKLIDNVFNPIKETKEKFYHKENNTSLLNTNIYTNTMNTTITFKTRKEEKSKKKKLKEEKIDEITDMDDIQFHRFIKLFYAYEKYFSNVKTIENILNKTIQMTKTKNEEESYIYNYVKQSLIFFNDYFFLDIPKVHNNYKNAILTCLRRLIESKIITKKKEKILYCYIELFHCHIALLKIFIKKVINDINKSNNSDEIERKSRARTLDEIQINQKNKIQNVIDIAKKSKEYIEKIKSKIFGEEDKNNNKNNPKENKKIKKEDLTLEKREGKKYKYKEFLNELQKIEEKNYNIEFNIFLIEQKYFYFFAKFAKLCGDYSTAIKNYLEVIDEKRLISNGLLCLKANKKICNIINFAKFNPSFLSIHDKDEKIINQILIKCKKNLKELQKVESKDLIVVLDNNLTSGRDVEKIYKLKMNQYKTINYIFEKFISINDRFGLYTYGNEKINFEGESDEINEIKNIRNNSVKKLIGLSFKTNENVAFIKGIIENFHDNIINDYENQSKMKQIYLNTDQNRNFSFNFEASVMKDKNIDFNDFNLSEQNLKPTINIIFKVINEENITEEQRKKYIIFITESFKDMLNPENNENINLRELFRDINYFPKSKIDRLYIIGSLLDEKNIFGQISAELAEHGIKNEYLEFENISELNKKFQNIGTLPRKYEYFNEKLN